MDKKVILKVDAYMRDLAVRVGKENNVAFSPKMHYFPGKSECRLKASEPDLYKAPGRAYRLQILLAWRNSYRY